jgi:alkylation response protein AidB-like acyl-CoA dehydrogenase
MIVDLLPTEEQEMIRDSVASLLSEKLPVTRYKNERNFHGAAEAALWPALVELGLFGMGLSEAQSGVGYTLAEEVLSAREMGRNLASTNLIASILGARVAALAGANDVRDAILGGETRVALATNAGGDEYVSFDAASDELLLSWDAQGATLSRAEGVWEKVDGIDEAVLLRNGRLGATVAKLSDREFASRAEALLASYQVGVSEAARDMATEYAKTRVQFGQPIGAFQAIKHSCADMAVRSESAMAQTFFAALAVEQGQGAGSETAAARLLADQAAQKNAHATIQAHGGMGFTFECDAHWFLKRAHVVMSINADRKATRAALLG